MRIDAVPVPEWVDVEWCSASVAIWCNRCRSGAGLYHTVLLTHPQEFAAAIAPHRNCEPRTETPQVGPERPPTPITS